MKGFRRKGWNSDLPDYVSRAGDSDDTDIPRLLLICTTVSVSFYISIVKLLI